MWVNVLDFAAFLCPELLPAETYREKDRFQECSGSLLCSSSLAVKFIKVPGEENFTG